MDHSRVPLPGQRPSILLHSPRPESAPIARLVFVAAQVARAAVGDPDMRVEDRLGDADDRRVADKLREQRLQRRPEQGHPTSLAVGAGAQLLLRRHRRELLVLAVSQLPVDGVDHLARHDVVHAAEAITPQRVGAPCNHLLDAVNLEVAGVRTARPELLRAERRGVRRPLPAQAGRGDVATELGGWSR